MRLLVTRPVSDAAQQAASLKSLGQEPVISPLLDIDLLQPPLELYRAQALVVTSRNAIRAAARSPQFAAMCQLPLLAVGPATARAAREAGFGKVAEGPGTAEGLANSIAESLSPDAGELIHLAGETRAFDLASALEPAGLCVETCVLYRSVPAKAFSPEAEQCLMQGTLDGVILMSPRTAKIFADLTRDRSFVLSKLCAFCLSQPVAANIANLGMRMRIARAPREEELLALIAVEASSS